ncbi:MAG: cell division protein CrgA [Acidimicrobiia bacterium]
MPESKKRKPKNRPPSAKVMEAAARAKDPSPTWYVAIMAGLMVVGVLLVLVRFIFNLDQSLLLIGLGAIAAGFLMTTNYR